MGYEEKNCIPVDDGGCSADYARYESAEQLDSHMSRMEHRGNMVMGDKLIEALDNSLFDAESVPTEIFLLCWSRTTPLPLRFWMITAIANPEYYPKVGDTITATYADDEIYRQPHRRTLHRRYTGGAP